MNQDINNLMVEIPSGKIELRDDRTKERWIVEIESFLLCKFPVTQDLYYEVMKENPSTFKGYKKPVETVTWKEAVIFCNSLSIKSGLKPCYSFTTDTEEIFFD